jgi:anti-sigma B factor antagonist
MAEPIGRVTSTQRNGLPILEIHGEVDASNVADIEADLEAATSTRDAFYVIDLSATTYFDSAGIRLLFSLARRLQSRRQELHIVVPESGAVRRVLELSAMDKVMPLHSSFESIGE